MSVVLAFHADPRPEVEEVPTFTLTDSFAAPDAVADVRVLLGRLLEDLDRGGRGAVFRTLIRRPGTVRVEPLLGRMAEAVYDPAADDTHVVVDPSLTAMGAAEMRPLLAAWLAEVRRIETTLSEGHGKSERAPSSPDRASERAREYSGRHFAA